MQGIRKREKVVMAIGMVMVRADGTGAEFCELGARKHAVIRELRLIRVARVDHPPNELCGLMERWDLHWKIFRRT